MGKINITYQNGGIGGVNPSTDFITGFIFDSEVFPAGFTEEDNIKVIYSIKDAEKLGILNTSVDETAPAAGGEIEITANGATGEAISISIKPAYATEIVLGSYTIKSGDTITATCAALTKSINDNTITTGFSATFLTDTISLVAPSGLGNSIAGANVITINKQSGSTFASTITNFGETTPSEIDIHHYTLKSFFNANPTAKVYVSYVDLSTFDADAIKKIQTFAEGSIRQLGIFTKNEFDADIITACQTAAADQATKHKPLSVVLAMQPKLTGTPAAFTTEDLINIRSLTCPRVSVTIGNEYGASKLGYQLIGKTGLYPTDLGAVLGHISKSKVSNSIAWVAQNVTQYAETMLITEDTWIDIEDTTIPDELNNKGYIFEGKYLGFAGSYFQNDAVADLFTSDYDSVKRVRVMDKVARIAYVTLVPYLSSPVSINAQTGRLSQVTIDTYTNVLKQALNTMFNNGEVSGFNVYINPAQNILATKELVVSILVVPIGSVDTISVNVGYTVALS